jgi:hypothetical protein
MAINAPPVVALLGQGPAGPPGVPAGSAAAAAAVFQGSGYKQPPVPFLVIHKLNSPPAGQTLDGISALKDGFFQFDSYASDQLTAQKLSAAVLALYFPNNAGFGGTLSDGTVIQFTEVTDDLDAFYEEGGEGYLYHAVLRIKAMYAETGTPVVLELLEGYGPPTIAANNEDLYLDLSTGNIYEMVAGVWVYVGNVPQGGETEMPSLNYHAVAAAGQNAASIKAAAGVVTGWKIYNNADYPIYVKLFNLAVAPTPGSSVPQQTIGVDAGLSDVSAPGPGVTYTTGIGIAIVKGIADTDGTAVAANDCVVDIFYQ